jgi:lactase-phlorizin hydrolase
VSWARIYPDEHHVNMEGIAYYNNLIDELLGYGIEPMLTIFHWDLPQYIQNYGGFTNASNVKFFEKYADTLYEHFGDRVKMWITINEPWVFCILGHGIGVHAPLMKNLQYECGHNVLNFHAAAFHLYKRKYAMKQKGEIGMSIVSHYFYPFRDEDTQFTELNMEFMLGWFAHPVLSANGDYPKVMIVCKDPSIL